MGWIRIRNFCLDQDPELEKFRAGSECGINHSGSTTVTTLIRLATVYSGSTTLSRLATVSITGITASVVVEELTYIYIIMLFVFYEVFFSSIRLSAMLARAVKFV